MTDISKDIKMSTTMTNTMIKVHQLLASNLNMGKAATGSYHSVPVTAMEIDIPPDQNQGVVAMTPRKNPRLSVILP